MSPVRGNSYRYCPRFEALEDRTAPSVTLVKDVFPGVENSNPESLVVAGARLFFFAKPGTPTTRLIVSTGDVGNSTTLTDSANPFALTAFGNNVIFYNQAAGRGYEPWKSNGNVGGTDRIADIFPDA